MLVCPFCRAQNQEELTVCGSCGRELRHGVQPMISGVRQPPAEIQSPPPLEPGPRWGRIAALGVVLLLIAGVSTWLAVRPQPCDHKFSSPQFSYCLTVPQGWNTSVAHVGPTDVDQFVSLPATAVVMSLSLRDGVTLEDYATFARTQAQQKSLVLGPSQPTTLGGVRAFEWRLSETGSRFQGVEVVTVENDTGWTVELNDDEATFGSHVDQFRAMLATFHFR